MGLINAQKGQPFGKITLNEQQFVRFEKDTTASAVVLYERGENYFEVANNRIQLVKKYHVKIKILNEEGFAQADISIPFYHQKDATERVKDIRAITHDGNAQSGVNKSQFFTKKINEYWSQIAFTFPNVKKGVILEYEYTLNSPYFYNFNGWSFQSDIPKLYSEFNAKIPGNYQYNRALSGYLKLAVNEATVAKDCFYVTGRNQADCEVLKYVMKDIPAFKEEETFMLASTNYISRIDFELSKWFLLNGETKTFTKTWKDVDSEFKRDVDIGRQLNKKNFFEKNVPPALLVEGDELTRAKNIYAFVQQHYTWNGKYSIYRNNRVKEAFEQRTGSVGEINMSLINLLNAAGIPANLMALSTRNNGLPKKSHPVMSDFNYVIAKVQLNGKDYLLDATDKFYPFGMLPYRCLNYYGRVMDFKNDSYWATIAPEARNKQTVRTMLSVDPEAQKLSGMFDVIHTGYEAIAKKRILYDTKEETYLENLEKQVGDEFSITNYSLLKERSTDKLVAERFEFAIEDNNSEGVIYINPFVVKFFSKSPFTLEERIYPIDFGYNRSYEYRINITVPPGYTAAELPAKKALQLPEANGSLVFNCELQDNLVVLYFKLDLKRSNYVPEFYPALKQLFEEAVNIQKGTVIALQKQE